MTDLAGQPPKAASTPAKEPPPVAGYYPQYLAWAATKTISRSFVWGATFGAANAILGTARMIPGTTPFKLGVDAARSTSLTLFAFYTVRDWGINPLWNNLQYHGDLQAVPPPSGMSHNVVSSGIAAGITSFGQSLAFERFDKRRIEAAKQFASRMGVDRPGGLVRTFMAGLVGMGLQVVGNSMNWAPKSEEEPVLDAKVVDGPAATKSQQASQPASTTWTGKIKEALPVKKLSDEEYIRSMEARESQLKEELKALTDAEAQWERAEMGQAGGEQQQQQRQQQQGADLSKAAEQPPATDVEKKKKSSWRSWIPGLSRS